MTYLNFDVTEMSYNSDELDLSQIFDIFSLKIKY